MATIGIGSIAAPLLIAAVDIRGALLITGALLPTLAILLRRRLAQLDAVPVPERELELLRGIELFARCRSRRRKVSRRCSGRFGWPRGGGFRAGRRRRPLLHRRRRRGGDRHRRRCRPRNGSSGYFGEISLLRDVPRTATVRAKGDVELFALDRDDFIAAVTGHAASAEVADSVIATRLGSIRPGMASV